jgi:hypothetical protein
MTGEVKVAFFKARLGELFPGCFVTAEARHYRREAESSSKANVRAIDSLASTVASIRANRGGGVGG